MYDMWGYGSMFMENVDVGGFWNKCITITICNIKRSSNLTISI